MWRDWPLTRKGQGPSVGRHLPVHGGEDLVGRKARQDALGPEHPADDAAAVHQEVARCCAVAAIGGRVPVDDARHLGQLRKKPSTSAVAQASVFSMGSPFAIFRTIFGTIACV